MECVFLDLFYFPQKKSFQPRMHSIAFVRGGVLGGLGLMAPGCAGEVLHEEDGAQGALLERPARPTALGPTVGAKMTGGNDEGKPTRSVWQNCGTALESNRRKAGKRWRGRRVQVQPHPNAPFEPPMGGEVVCVLRDPLPVRRRQRWGLETSRMERRCLGDKNPAITEPFDKNPQKNGRNFSFFFGENTSTFGGQLSSRALSRRPCQTTQKIQKMHFFWLLLSI